MTGPGDAQRGGFATPEEAALDGWSHTLGGEARIMSVDVRGTRAEVLIEVGPGYPDHVYCCRLADGWHETVSGNGPSPGWDDPTFLIWADSR